jgi:hypothetical protein
MADRIEREIEEILKKIDKFPEGSRQPKIRKSGGNNRPPRSSGGNATRWLSAVSMRKVMMWALVAVIVAFFLRGVPGGYWLLIGSIIVFATAFFLSTRGGGGPATTQKRWRGQTLDLSEPSWPDRLKAWWKGRKRR